MRLAWVLPFLHALFLSVISPSSVKAIHPFSLSRQTYRHNNPKASLSTPSSRQYISPRLLVDICASVDLGILVELEELLGLELPGEISTGLNLCLCLKDLDIYLYSDARLVWLADILGRDALLAHLETLINTSSTQQECTLPAHAHRTCNNQDICHYNCDENYVRRGDSCICAAPFSICNGVCGYHMSGCASPVPRAVRSEPEPATTVSVVRAICGPHTVACGARDPQKTMAYECLHIRTTAENVTWPQRPGVNCGRIPHVEQVTCTDGRCVVTMCAADWIPSKEQDACVQSPTTPRRMKRSKIQEIGNPDITLDIHVTIDLAQLLRAMYGFHGHSAHLRGSSALEASLIVQAADQISQAAIDVVGSVTVGSFLDNTRRLLDLAQLLDELLSACNCAQELGLEPLRGDVGIVIRSSIDILDWYREASAASGSSGPVDLETPVTISLNRLLGGLGFSGIETVIKIGGLGGGISDSVNGLLNGLGVGPADERRTHSMGGDIDVLLVQLQGLVGLVLGLGDPALTLMELDGVLDLPALLVPVSRAMLGLLVSTNLSALLDSIDLVILASTSARTALASYGGFSNITTKLSLVAKTAIDIRALCSELQRDDMSSEQAGSTVKLPQDGSVVIVLDSLLQSLGVGVSGNVTIGGLGRGLSGTLNGILGMLNMGAKESSDGIGMTDCAVFMDLDLTQLFATVVEGAIDLEMKSNSPGPLSSLLAGLMPPVLASLQTVLVSPTVTGLISEVDQLLVATKEMKESLTKCNCTTELVMSSAGRFENAVINVQEWLDEHPGVTRVNGAGN